MEDHRGSRWSAEVRWESGTGPGPGEKGEVLPPSSLEELTGGGGSSLTDTSVLLDFSGTSTVERKLGVQDIG